MKELQISTDRQTAITPYLALSVAAVAAALVLVAASSAAPAPGVHVPSPTGRFHVGTRSMALTDRARREPEQAKQPRSLVIQLWYPAAATGRPAAYLSPAVARFIAKSNGVSPALLQGVTLDAIADAAPLQRPGGWPVVLFSPGFGVERGLYAGLTEDLASHGYVVVAIDHPHDAAIVEFPDGHVVIPGSQMDIQRAHTVRVADTRFVLTELARLARSGVFAGRLDLGRIGMFGHSLGGAAAASTMLVDRRVRAGADLDGLLFGQVRTSGLSRPFLLMNGEPGFAATRTGPGSGRSCTDPTTPWTSSARSTLRSATSSSSCRPSCGRTRPPDKLRDSWSGMSTGSRHSQPSAPTSAPSSTDPCAGSHNHCSRRPQAPSPACA